MTKVKLMLRAVSSVAAALVACQFPFVIDEDSPNALISLQGLMDRAHLTHALVVGAVLFTVLSSRYCPV